MSRANEEAFDELHGLVTNELTSRIRLGADCSTADLKAAIDWLAKNNITGVAMGSSPLAQLLAGLEVSEEEVERVLR